MKRIARWLPALLLGGAFVACLFRFDLVETLLAPLARRKAVFAERESLVVLAGQHLFLVATTSIPAFAAAFALALATAGAGSAAARALLLDAAAIGETVPTVALMALLVPGLGYGFPPVAAALFLYGLLPVFRNTLSGIQSTPRAIVDAAAGCGMTESQALWRVRLPWAWPLVIQGIRVSLVINLAAATVGAVVGAGGFGSLIVSGIRSFDPILILKGSLPVALLALCVDSALRAVERLLDERRGIAAVPSR